MFAKERGQEFPWLLELVHGAPSAYTFERVFKKLKSESLQSCPDNYGKAILETLSDKQIVLYGKKLKGISLNSKSNSGLYILNA